MTEAPASIRSFTDPDSLGASYLGVPVRWHGRWAITDRRHCTWEAVPSEGDADRADIPAGLEAIWWSDLPLTAVPLGLLANARLDMEATTEKCESCGGGGKVFDSLCDCCGGAGDIHSAILNKKFNCPACYGRCVLHVETSLICEDCEGTGRIEILTKQWSVLAGLAVATDILRHILALGDDLAIGHHPTPRLEMPAAAWSCGGLRGIVMPCSTIPMNDEVLTVGTALARIVRDAAPVVKPVGSGGVG